MRSVRAVSSSKALEVIHGRLIYRTRPTELLTASAARQERRPEAERQCRQPGQQPERRQQVQQERLQPELRERFP